MNALHAIHDPASISRYINRHELMVLTFHRDFEGAAAHFAIGGELLASYARVDLEVAGAPTKGALYGFCFKHTQTLTLLRKMQRGRPSPSLNCQLPSPCPLAYSFATSGC